MRIILVSLILFSLPGCFVQPDEQYSELLGKDYFYLGSSGRAMIYRGDLKKTNTHQLKISGNIQQYRFDERFIVALRQITALEIRDSSRNRIFRQQSNGDTLQYWIIDKSNDSIYGPLRLGRYRDLLAELKINDSVAIP